MKIENISTGQIFKNYKELCLELEIEIKSSSNSKNAQFKELARYCKFSKSGHKFIIEEVYEKPLEKIENRGKSEGSRNNNSVYGDMIQLLILDLLAQCKGGKVSISRGKLMLVINMINENYRPCGENVKKLAKYTEIEEAVIYDFYNTSNSNFKSAVETALSNLMDKRIIWYDSVTKVAEKDTRVHRIATDEEKENILETEKQILNELKYKQVSQVRCSRDWKLFKTKVKNLLNKQSEIEYYYLAYDIVVNKKYLEEERKELFDLLLEEIERDEYKGELNATVYFNLIENAEKRHKKGFTSGKMGKHRSKSEYVDNIKKLVTLLIDDTAGDICEHVMNIKLEDTTISEEDYEMLMSLEAYFG